jgi:fructoselysine-6-P-deglycase FrlB-like protein
MFVVVVMVEGAAAGLASCRHGALARIFLTGCGSTSLLAETIALGGWHGNESFFISSALE